MRPLVLALSICALASAACQRAPAPEGQPPSTIPTAMTEPSRLHAKLQQTIEGLLPELDAIPAERRAVLEQLAAFVRQRHAAGEPARLLFICTHNSRRSHMGQLWAAAAAAYYGVEGVETYSGGTEATAFNPRAVAAMRSLGFTIDAGPNEEDNPRYQVTLGPEAPAMTAFSKTWADPQNPSEGFVAVMTCSQADEACPFVRGSALRVSLPYEDPKVADDAPEERATYEARARQIAAEMLFLFRLVHEERD